MSVSDLPRADQPAAVYRLYDAAGGLLYIGSSYYPQLRTAVHRAKSWGPEIAKRTEEWFPDRLTAYEEETAAIKAERPRCNIVDNPTPPPKAKTHDLGPSSEDSTVVEAFRTELMARVDRINAMEDHAEAIREAGKALDEIPAIYAQLRAIRAEGIQRMRNKGMTWPEIGSLFGVTGARAQQMGTGLSGNERRKRGLNSGQPRKRRSSDVDKTPRRPGRPRKSPGTPAA